MSAARRVRRARGDRGSAVVELVAVGLVLLLPLVHLVVVIARVQAGSFAVDAGARAAARALAAAPDPATGDAHARAAVLLALRDQGFDDAAAAAVDVRCQSAPCAQPGTRVTVVVTHQVLLPGVPALVDAALPLAVPVTGESSAVADRFAAPAAAAPGAPPVAGGGP